MAIFTCKESYMSYGYRKKTHRHSGSLSSNGGYEKQSKWDGWYDKGNTKLKTCKVCKLASDNETDVCTLCDNQQADHG